MSCMELAMQKIYWGKWFEKKRMREQEGMSSDYEAVFIQPLKGNNLKRISLEDPGTIAQGWKCLGSLIESHKQKFSVNRVLYWPG